MKAFSSKAAANTPARLSCLSFVIERLLGIAITRRLATDQVRFSSSDARLFVLLELPFHFDNDVVEKACREGVGGLAFHCAIPHEAVTEFLRPVSVCNAALPSAPAGLRNRLQNLSLVSRNSK
jgi:hypothetical protein